MAAATITVTAAERRTRDQQPGPATRSLTPRATATPSSSRGPMSPVTDPDSANFDTGTLTIVVGVIPEADERVDVITIGQIELNGVNVRYNGTTIGTSPDFGTRSTRW
ncbi:MAG: hypothetical protein R2856_08045 [Caldilineaceae bacterium]